MKTKMSLIMVGILALLFSFGNVSGQEQSSIPANANGRLKGGMFSAQQKEMLKQIGINNMSFRKNFKTTISQNQKDLLSDPRVMPFERKKAFRASLTDEQVKMIKNHHYDVAKLRKEFRATLTPEQKYRLRKYNLSRGRGAGPLFLS